uniref:EIF-2B GDP-GTP exchange factor subunit epsilon n=1 Tax=Syphacia muris TaxID=451379 RepID=A0A0N5AQK2_9BILA
MPIFDELLCLLNLYDILMCEGLTAFAFELQEKISRNEEICRVVESTEVLKSVYLSPILLKNNFSFHKLSRCFELIGDTLLRTGTDRSVIVILCRDRCVQWISRFVAALVKQFSADFVNVISCADSDQSVKNLSASSLKFRKCNIIVIPCGNDTFSLDVGYVDTVICLDEGLSLLHYTGGISVSDEGNIYSLCTANYEVNVCPIGSDEYNTDTIQKSLIRAVNLCKDNVRIFPVNWNPEVYEYWAHNEEKERYFPSSYEEIVVSEVNGTDAISTIKSTFKKTMTSESLIVSEVDDSLIWLETMQKPLEICSSQRTIKVAEVLSAKQELLNEESKRPAF